MPNKKLTGYICAGLVLGGFSNCAAAVEYNWNCISNYWDSTSCWNPKGLPAVEDDVLGIKPGSLIKIDAVTRYAFAKNLTLDNSTTLQQIGGTLTTDHITVGSTSLGKYKQLGGTNATSGMTIGSNYGATGNYNLSGVFTTLTMGGTLAIGYSGTGTLDIDAGGVLNNSRAFVGMAFGNGTVTVSDVGSQWNNSQALYVGGNAYSATGNGDVVIANGGALSVGDTLQIWNTGSVTLNGGSITTQYLNNKGLFNFIAGTLSIGSDLTVEPGGLLGNTISLTGVKALNVGGATNLNGAATLLLDGGTFSTGSLKNNGGFAFNTGTFNLTNDNLVVGTNGLFGSLVQFNTGQKLNVTNSIMVDNGAALALNNTAVSAGAIDNQGQIVLNGLAANLSAGIIDNRGQIVLNGLAANLGGGTLNNTGLLSGTGQVSAAHNNTGSGQIRVNADDDLRFTGSANSNYNRINLLGGSVDFTQGLTNAAGGLIAGHGTLATGSTQATGLANQGNLALSGTTDIIGDVNNTGKIIVSGGATATFYDDVIHNGSEIRVSSGSQAVFFGDVSGAGNYTGSGDTFFEGGFFPGNSPALVSFGGSMTLGQLSHTTMELGGTLRGSEYDAFNIGGTLTLAGALNIELYDLGSGLFSPSVGDTFDLFTAETINGEFNAVAYAFLGSGLDWRLDYLTDFVGSTDYLRLSVVSSVPLPAGVWLFGTGMVGLIVMGRSKAV